jgi:hypothetical protein
MAQFKPRFASHLQLQNKSQPRYLARSAPAQQCNWTGCPAQATSQHKDKVYCASHLLTSLQQQWQE